MADSLVRVEQGKLTDIVPDPQNANRHKVRGAKVVETSLRQRKFFRPMAAFGKDVEHPVMGAGNLTQEMLVSMGIENAVLVYSDGSIPIVHVRTDIAPDSPEAKQLALEDNRSAELSLDWDVGVIAAMTPEVLGDLWTPTELSNLGQQWAGRTENANDPDAEWQDLPEYQREGSREPFQTVALHFATAADRDAFAELVDQKIVDTTRYLWYPKREFSDLTKLTIADES
jgi:hypothetical protein